MTVAVTLLTFAGEFFFNSEKNVSSCTVQIGGRRYEFRRMQCLCGVNSYWSWGDLG